MIALLLVPLALASTYETPTYDIWRDGPPPGRSNAAVCPVTNVNITISPSTPTVDFHNGQKLYFGSKEAAAAYKASPKDFWLAPHEMPLDGADGMRGLPDLRHTVVRCPRSNESLTVDMQTPRVLHRHGQAVYFCCFGCVAAFWRDPVSMLA